MMPERVWHKSYAAGVPADIVFEEITMPEVLTRSARRFPDRPALIFLGRTIKFRELEGLVNRFACVLEKLGVKKGDRVATMLPNIPQAVITNFAVLKLGAVTALNNPLYTERELGPQLNDAGARLLVTLDTLLPKALILRNTTGIETIVACHLSDYLPAPLKHLFPFVKRDLYRKVLPERGVHEFRTLMGHQREIPIDSRADWNAVAALLYTGGTTGVSKGVMLTHANISVNVQQLRAWFSHLKDGEERMLAVFPFFHSAGHTLIQYFNVYAGWADVLVPRPETGTVIEMLKKFKPSVIPAVPTIYSGLLQDSRFLDLDLRFVKAFLGGAAPMTVDMMKKLGGLCNAAILDIYGMTETAPLVTCAPWGGRIKPGTVGLPVPGTDMKIVDLEAGNRELPAGEIGEIAFRGPQIMKGYHNQPEETAAVLRAGWMYTGDIGFMDGEGYLTIVDRKKDMIVASGYNVYPKEIDEILLGHPLILEACTIGVPDPYRGETVKACIVPRPGAALGAEEVVAYCRDMLASYKVPKQIEFLAALPKSSVGKVLRRERRELEGAKRAGAETSGNGAEGHM